MLYFRYCTARHVISCACAHQCNLDFDWSTFSVETKLVYTYRVQAATRSYWSIAVGKCVTMMLALLRHFHMGTLMRIEYASDPDWLRSHECTSDVNPIGSTSGGGLDAHSNRIILLFMIHARLRLPRDRWLGWLYSLAWLMARVYGSFSFCSCSNVGEEIGLFADGQVEWYSMVKLKAQWFRCLQYKFDVL